MIDTNGDSIVSFSDESASSNAYDADGGTTGGSSECSTDPLERWLGAGQEHSQQSIDEDGYSDNTWFERAFDSDVVMGPWSRQLNTSDAFVSTCESSATAQSATPSMHPPPSIGSTAVESGDSILLGSVDMSEYE